MSGREIDQLAGKADIGKGRQTAVFSPGVARKQASNVMPSAITEM
jgi:hypothetical protein